MLRDSDSGVQAQALLTLSKQGWKTENGWNLESHNFCFMPGERGARHCHQIVRKLSHPVKDATVPAFATRETPKVKFSLNDIEHVCSQFFYCEINNDLTDMKVQLAALQALGDLGPLAASTSTDVLGVLQGNQDIETETKREQHQQWLTWTCSHIFLATVL